MSMICGVSRPMLMSMIHAAARSHVEVHVPCCCTRSCGCLWSVLPLKILWKSIICAAADCYGQGSFFCSDIDDYRLKIENEKHLRFL